MGVDTIIRIKDTREDYFQNCETTCPCDCCNIRANCYTPVRLFTIYRRKYGQVAGKFKKIIVFATNYQVLEKKNIFKGKKCKHILCM